MNALTAEKLDLLEAAERGELFRSVGAYFRITVEVDMFTAHTLGEMVKDGLLLVPAHGTVDLSGDGERILRAARR